MIFFVTLRAKLPVQQKWPRLYNTPCKKKRTFLSGLEQKTFLFWLTPYIYMPVQPDFGDLKKLRYSIATIVCYTVCYVMLQVLKKNQAEVFFFQFYHSIISEWMLIDFVRRETSRRDRYTSHILFMWAYIWFYILYMYIHVYKCEQHFFKFYQSINDEPINQS